MSKLTTSITQPKWRAIQSRPVGCRRDEWSWQSAGKIVTSCGPGGPRGESGAAIYGGSPADPGMPITHEMLVTGQVSTPGVGRLPVAKQIFPFQCNCG